MKNKILKFLPAIICFLGFLSAALAQPLPNSTGPNGLMPGAGAPAVNCQGNAPSGDGIWIVLVLAVLYLIYHKQQIRKQESATS